MINRDVTVGCSKGEWGMVNRKEEKSAGRRLNFLRALLGRETKVRYGTSGTKQSAAIGFYRNRPTLESLESRLMLTADVSLDNGSLLLQETTSGSDTLQIGFDSVESAYLFSDSVQPLTTSIQGAVNDQNSDGTNTIKVPSSLVTGDITIKTGAEDDTVTVLSSFDAVADRSVVLDLEAGSDTVFWNAAPSLTNLSVSSETTYLEVSSLETFGEQHWLTNLQISVPTFLYGQGVFLQDADLGQKDFFVHSATDIEVLGSITNGGSGEVYLDAIGGVSITDSQIVTNAGGIFVTASGSGVSISGSELIAGSGEIHVTGKSFDGNGLVLRNSSVETSANAGIVLSGNSGSDGNGILIEGTAESKATITSQDGDITLVGAAARGGGIGVLMSHGVLTTKNGSQLLTGHSAQRKIAGTLLQNSDLVVTGNGDVSFVASTGEVQFGSGDNRFNLDFGRIDDVYNFADTSGSPNPAGSVGYSYQMSRYEISRAMINKANASADLGITLYDMSQNGGNGDDLPATGISWYEAAQFVNWLNVSEGHSAAYKFVDGNFQLWESNDQGFDAVNPYRNLNAKYVLPSMDEWYKAAYYDPSGGQYFDFATGSDETPSSVTSGTAPNTAVYGLAESQGPANIDNAGGLSPYGMMAMSGNVWEWIETAYDQSNSLSDEDRFIRGGAFWTDRDAVSSLKSSDSYPYDPASNDLNSGFRVANLFQENNGLVVLDGSSVSTNSGLINVDGSLQSFASSLSTSTGLIQVKGQGANIWAVDSSLSSTSGDILLEGDGTRDDVPGIDLVNTVVSTSGSGLIALHGEGGSADGVRLETIAGEVPSGLTSAILAEDGYISITGFGGIAGGDGINVFGTTVKTIGAGEIVLSGIVFDAAGRSIAIDGSEIATEGTGSILLQAESAVIGKGAGSVIELSDATITVSSGDLSVFATGIELVGASTTNLGSDVELISVISGEGDLIKSGPGSLSITENSLGTGTITVIGGSLLVNASLAGNVLVETGGTLGGFGTISGSVLATGTGIISPGNSAGLLGTGDLELGVSSSVTIEVGGTTAGTTYDQLEVTGSVTLAGAINLGLINNYAPAAGDVFTLINNDGTDAVSGTFEGLAEGDLLAADGIAWRISYADGTGNDVTITRLGSVFDVVNLNTSGTGSLAQAITDANTTTGGDWVRILTTGILPVTSTALLPEITDQVLIDGTTAPEYDASPRFEIRGTEAGADSSGIRFSAASTLSELRGISVTHFGEHGVVIDADEMTVTGNWIGVAIDSEPLGNKTAGIFITGDGSLIGGGTAVLRNVISDNQTGVLISGGDGNVIAGNEIGTDVSGELDYGNTVDGIKITSGVSNQIGGSTPDERNVISGNDSSGIHIEGSTTVGTIVLGNYVGVSDSGVALGNTTGITVTNLASATEVGGAGSGAGNVIAASVTQGIHIADATATLVQGNYIGTNPQGAEARPNSLNGIYLQGDVSGTVIGGIGGENVIAGNELSGINVDLAIGGVQILGNLIGTTATGDVALGNRVGITVKADEIQIGGSSVEDQNVISGNTVDGIHFVADDSLQNSGNVVQGNLIGLTADGLGSLGNTEAGINIAAPNVIIGGTSSSNEGLLSGAGNVISGNATGIQVAAANTVVSGNYVGSDWSGTGAIGNGMGISVEATGINTTLGGSSTPQKGFLGGAGNLVSGNSSHGIRTEASSITLQGNYVGTDVTGTTGLGNTGFGIYLAGGDGVVVGGFYDEYVGSLAGNGNLVSGNEDNGIQIDSQTTNVLIQGNFVGTDSTGTTPIGNSQGISSSGSSVQIGGSRIDSTGKLSGAGNLVSGNTGVGIVLSSSGTTIQGNYVGVDVAGSFSLGNGDNGIETDAANQVIGTDDDGENDASEGNLISGNAAAGIKFDQTTGGVVAGNRIGTNADGTAAISNEIRGVFIHGGSDHRIGTDSDGVSDAAESNLISGNVFAGVLVLGKGEQATSDVLIAGNLIGTDAAGTAAIGNRSGITTGSLVTGVIIGGTSESARNVISGNNYQGINLLGEGAGNHLVRGNYIGLDVSGTVEVGNGQFGIYIQQSANNLIGGPGAEYRNVISGNQHSGVWITGLGANDNLVQGNFIGTTSDGASDLGNAGTGIVVTNYALRTQIGTDADGVSDESEGNVVAGNDVHGIHLARSLSVGLSQLDSVLAGELPATTATSTITAADFSDSSGGYGGDWDFDNEVPGGGGDWYFVRSEGQLTVSTAGEFSFAIGGDDGGRLLIDGQPVIVDDAFHAFTRKYGSLSLSAGTHDFIWETQESHSEAAFELSVNVGADKTGDITEANGWRVLGAASPHSEISLVGDLSVTAYYPGTIEAGTTIGGNKIGTDLTGLKVLGNSDRGIFSQESVVTIGGTESVQRNVISGNGTDGVTLMGWVDAPGATLFTGNYVGVGIDGETALPNEWAGVSLGWSDIQLGGSGSLAGGTLTGAGNVISGNGLFGIWASGTGVETETPSQNAVVQGNLVGTDATGTKAVPNGIGLQMAGTGHQIGGASDLESGKWSGEGNLISGNASHGLISSGDSIVVEGNFVGTDASGTADLGNAGHGIYLTDGDGIRVGNSYDDYFETLTGRGNLISGNTLDGIHAESAVGSGAAILGNYIGTDVTGTQSLGNDFGIRVYADGLQIGGSRIDSDGKLSGAGNLISGNTGAGVYLGASGGGVQGNYVGVTLAGTAALANDAGGLSLDTGASYNVVGTDGDGEDDDLESNLISGNKTDGIHLYRSTENVIAGNRIGTDFEGVAAIPNETNGVFDQAGSKNRIGTNADDVSDSLEANLISGNLVGIQVGSEDTIGGEELTIAGNLIGTNAAGTGALPNSEDGIRTLQNTTAVVIGGATTAARNVISGNSGYGIALTGSGSGTHQVQGNYVGLDITGAAAMGNALDGIYIDTSANNLIGGLSDGHRNVISGNLGSGVLISASNGNELYGNHLGTNAAGTAALANGENGIVVTAGSADSQIGSGVSGSRNLISGHALNGVLFSEAGTGNRLQGNYIGTSASGATAMPNATDALIESAGVKIYDQDASQVIVGTDGDGSLDSGEGNLISGNDQSGVLILGVSASSGGHTVAGNSIGVDAGFNGELPNLGHGVTIRNSNNNLIGSDGDGVSDSLEANQISGNRNAAVDTSADYVSGVMVVDDTANDGSLTLGNVIAGNAIGTDRTGLKPLPNQGNGITIDSAKGTVIGGAGIPNLLRFSELAGVRITGTTEDGIASDLATSLLANSFQANEGLPVDVGDSGQNLNSAASDVLDFPIFTSAAIEDGVMTLEGFAEEGLTFDLYLNAGQVGQQFGQGLTWVAEFTEGSDSDLDATVGSYGPEVRGVTVAIGEITRNKFSFEFTLPDGVNNGVQMTGIASRDGVSEFSSLILGGELASVVAPEITLETTSDPLLINELVAMTIDGSFYDPDSLSWTATVDYGDGGGSVPLALSAARTFTLENIYDTPGDYTVTVQIVDSALAVGTAQFDVTVADVVPDVDYSSFDFTTAANEGGAVSLSGAFTDGNTAHVVEITWGDSESSILNLEAGTLSFDTTHEYADDSNAAGSTTSSDIYSVAITIRDASSASGTDSSDGVFLTEISNVRPTLDSLLFNGSSVASDTVLPLDEGSTLALSGAFTDPGLEDVHTVRIDWGDGTITETDLTQGDRTFSGLDALSHVYENNAESAYTVTIELRDDDEPAQPTKLVRSVSILDVAPSNVSVAVVPESISEADSIQVSGTFVDPGTADAHQVTVSWGDGSPDSILNLAAGVLSFGGSSLTHSYLDNSVGGSDYTITVEVSDLDDSTAAGSGTTTVAVDNVAPTIGAPVVKRLDGTVGSIEEGSSVVATGSFADVSTLDRHRVTISWGDGTTSSATVDAMTRTYSATHRYLDDYAAAEITATVSDGRYVGTTFTADGGQATSVAVTQTIANVAPTPTIAPVAGSTPAVTQLVAEVIDPGLDDLADLTYQWQVSTGGSYSTLSTEKIFTFDSTAYSQPRIRLLVADDDGGEGQDDVSAVFGTDASETITITDSSATISDADGGAIPISSGLDGWLTRIMVLGFGGGDTLDASQLTADYTAILDGGQELDYLLGGAGEDVFYPNDGNDWVSGGTGDDSYVLTPNSTLTVLDISGSNVLDFSRSEFGDDSGITFDLTSIRNSGNLADFDPAVDTQVVSTASGTNHEVAAFGNFTTLLGSDYGDDLTIGSDASVDGGAGADTINLSSDTSKATVNGGADDDLLLVSGTNISELTFSGDDGLDVMRNIGEISGLTFGGGADDDILENTGVILGTLNFGGDDGVDILTNTGTIGDLIFSGGADDDIFVNNGTVPTSLNFGGDEDILLSGVGSISSLTFAGDDGSDIFTNLGVITELTFTGGADDDIFINVGTSTSLNFGGDDDVLLSNTGTVGSIGNLVFSGDDGIDEFRNFGDVTTLTFNGGADDDIFTNYAGGSLTSLAFGGDDGLDLLQNAGTISGLVFSGGADDDTLLNTADGVLSNLVFGGDDGSDILTNYGVIAGLDFGGGADDDILTNVGSISSTLVFGGDDGVDSLLNTGSISALTFGGGADDDILNNYSGASISALEFGGDDGIDTLNNSGEITQLDFVGGADADVLVNATGGDISQLFFGGDYEPDGSGGFTPIANLADNGADALGNYGLITELMFRGGSDDDVLVNYTGASLGTLNFGGDAGVDLLRNDGTVTDLSFGGGADDDTLINNGTVTGALVFGGDQQFSLTDELEQISSASDDGVDTLANYGSLGGLTFTGGADADILLNASTGSVSTLVFGGDSGADILQNLGTVSQLTFNGGADDDLLVNEGSGIAELVFSGDAGADILRNAGSSITALTFSGGADDDLLLNTASTITSLIFSGGADDDVLQNTGDSISALTFTGDDGLDVLLNTGSSIATLSFGGGADDDLLRSTGSNIGVIIFGGDIDSATGEPIADTNGGKDTLVVSGSGSGASDSRILFSGDDGIDAFQNDATGFSSVIFNGGADNDVFLNNASSIGGVVFNGGADDDVLENNGDSLTSLVFAGDEGADSLYNTGASVTALNFSGGADNDIFLNTGESLSGVVFSGDDGADIFSNTGTELSSLTFNGGADNDIFQNTGVDISGITFSGDDGADLFWNKAQGLNASTLVFSGDAGADILVNDASGVSGLVFTGGADDDAFQNSGVSLSGLVFSGGADDDRLLNTSTGSILSLSFGGDDGSDILQTVGAVTSLIFGGGADDDTLSTQGTVETLVFMGDGELDVDGNLVQISAASDDGVDTLLNEATVSTLTFTGGADDDVFVNNNTVTSLTFNGGADDDTFQNNALVTSLVFSGGADDDMLINNASAIPSLTFNGDDGIDSFVNNGNTVASLIFNGGADEDVLRIHGTGLGDITFTGGADASADTFHFKGTAASGSSITFTAGDGDDFFAWRGAADAATFNAGAGNDTSIIQGSGSLTLDGGEGNDSYLFEADPAATVSVVETWTGTEDSSSDTLDFSSFTGGALNLDLRATSSQALSSNLTITLSDARGIENVTGTPEADTIYGNLQSNTILGAEYSDGYSGVSAADRGVTQWVLLDFDTYTDSGEHVYTTDERDEITSRVENVYRGSDTSSPIFDVRVVQTRSEIPVVDGQFVTISFNDTPAFGRPGGLASEIDPGNLNLGGTAVLQVNGLLGGTITSDDTTGEGGDMGGDKGLSLREISDDPVGVSKPDATSENFVLLSAKIAAHELAHLMGLRHQDSFGPIGLGIHDPPGLDGYNPVFPGPVAAVETFDHLLGSGASVGTDRFNDLRNLFFSERSAIKLAFATADTDDVFTVESSSAHGTSATAQELPLRTLDVPNTLSSGLNSSKTFFVQLQSVEGAIEIDPATGKSESDWYSFSGTAGDVMNLELYSNSLIRYGTDNDSYVDSILRVWYEIDGSLTLVPWFGSEAVNDDVFEPTDSSLVDLILPIDSTYYIEVDTFKRDPNDALFDSTNATSPLNPDNPNNYLSYPDLLDRFESTRDDTDIGNYQLVVSRFDRSSPSDGVDTIVGYGGVDTIDAGDGDDYSLTVAVGGSGSVDEGSTFSRAISLVDRAAVDWSGSTVNYGDGEGDLSLSVASDGTATLSQILSDSGAYTVSVAIRDDIGQEVVESFALTVNNVAPVVDTLTGGTTPDEGSTETYSFTASDPGDDTFSVVEITGGDLGTVSNINLNAATGSGTFDVTFGEVTSGSTASNTLSVKLKDSDDAESNVLTLELAVQNVSTGPTDLALSASSIEENAASGTAIGDFSTTDSGGGETYTYSLVSGVGDTDNTLFSISGNSLSSAASFDYEASATRSIRVKTADTLGNSYEESFTISVTNITDEDSPSSAIASLPTTTTTATISIDVSGTDTGEPASGIASYALYYSTGNEFTQFATVTSDTPTATFEAESNTLYWFRSLARDVAGNEEAKSVADTYTRVGDVTLPASEITAVTAVDSGLLSLVISGEKSSGRPLTAFDIYMSVDGGAYQNAASVNSTKVTDGVFSGAASIQGIIDGAPHEYAFYTRAIDGSGNIEAAPVNADQTITATFSGASLAAQGIDVQKGANQRSYVRNVDILFSDDPSDLLDAGRVAVERFAVSSTEDAVGVGTGSAVTVSSKAVIGNTLELDFGANGIGGRWHLGDGFYRILVDMDNNGSFTDGNDAVFEFYRLFGDANGDGTVNRTDDLVIRSQMNRSGTNLDGDVDGSGRVTGRDRLFARRRFNQKLPAWMTDWLDD